MATSNDDGKITLVAAAALSRGQRVKWDSSGYAAVAGDEPSNGVVLETTASGDPVPVQLRGQGGTAIVLVDEASAAGATLYPQTGGKYGDTAGTAAAEMTALEAASGDGSLIEASWL